jgi:hypothetical protein
METLGNKNVDKSTANYFCKLCDYKTSHKGHFNEHLNSSRHCKRKQMETKKTKIDDNFENVSNNCEICCKEFSSRSGLWKHKKTGKCISEDKCIQINGGLTEQLVIELVKQNKELLEIIKNGTHVNNSHNTTTNSNNKAFNLNFFLNETCKDAMNITDFVDSIKLQLIDLEHVGEVGYVEGISDIIVKNLKKLDITKRPVHCTDKKRETMYIKDENKWEKEEDTKKLKNAIQEVSRKSMISLVEWQDTNPDFQDMDSEFSNKCISMTQQCIAGSNRDVYYPKVIRSLAKETMIEKNM